MSFRFNFQEPPSETENKQNKDARGASLHDQQDSILPAKEVVTSTVKGLDSLTTTDLKIGDLTFHVVQRDESGDKSQTLSDITADSDLVPGVYEGGLKIWECGVDLAEYLSNHEINLKDLQILELGCGAGLPGLTGMYRGAGAVDFQDYNPEVIQEITIPNVELNKCPNCKCRFFSGDWSSLPLLLMPANEASRYDIILTAETIYNTENYSKLHIAFAKLLKQDGTIYLAAKSNYFGVGGGTRVFEDFLKREKTFTSKVCFEIQSGVPREILKITRLKS